MKRYFFVFAVFTLIFAFIGCNTDSKLAQESKKPSTAKTSQETTKNEQQKAPETPAESATPTISEEEPEIIGSAEDIVAWRYNIKNIQYLIDRGRIFIVNYEDNAKLGKIICLDSKTGKKYWENNILSGWKLISGETGIIVYDPNNNIDNKYGVVCFDIETGEKIFEISKYKYIVSTVILNNCLYFATNDCSLHCYDIKTGKCIWVDKLVARFNAEIYTSEDKIFCAFDKTLGCYNAQDGSKLWLIETVENASNPMVVGGKVYFNAKDSSSSKNTFYCLDLQTGNQEWSINLSPRTTELFINQNKALLFDHRDDSYVYYDFSQKKEIWSINSRTLRSPRVISSYLYLLIENRWSIVDIATGKTIKNLGFNENYNFAEQRIYSATSDYFQCVVPDVIITDNMFDQQSRKRLQRIYSNDDIQVSNYPDRPSEKVYGFTMKKKLWETPNDWKLVKDNFPGASKSYFWVTNNKVLVKKEANKTYFYACLEKSTGKMLWEISADNYRINGYENGILKLHSIKNNREITIADGSIKESTPKAFAKLIVFEVDLPKTKGFYRYGWVYDLTDGYYLYVAFDNTKQPEPLGFCYLISDSGKMTTLDDKNYIAFDYLRIWRNKDKLYVSKEKENDLYNETESSLEIDIKSDTAKTILNEDIPDDVVLLGVDKDFEQKKYILDQTTIAKIGVQPYKSLPAYECSMKGINFSNYAIFQREISEGIEYQRPYSDYTGIYDAKILKKLWSYDKKVSSIYLHDSTIIIDGEGGVLFCDLATGKTLLKYDKATLLSKVGDICFVASGNKILAVNLKKLPR